MQLLICRIAWAAKARRLVAALVVSAPAYATTIDFETYPDGRPTIAGSRVTTEYTSVGVTFDGLPSRPVLGNLGGLVGSTALQGRSQPIFSQQDDPPSPYPLQILLNGRARSVSFDVFADNPIVTVVARDSNGTTFRQTPLAVSGSGNAGRYSVSAADIRSIQVVTGFRGQVAIDNLSYFSSPSDAVIQSIVGGAVVPYASNLPAAWVTFESTYGLRSKYPQNFADFFNQPDVIAANHGAFLQNGIGAKFTPANGASLEQAARQLGVDHFNWVSLIWSPLDTNIPRFDGGTSCNQGLADLFRNEGIGAKCPNRDDLVFYLDERYSVDGREVYTADGSRHAAATPDLQTRLEAWIADSGRTLLFNDAPNVAARFLTCLAGVRNDGSFAIYAESSSDSCFRWTSTGRDEPIVLQEDIGAGVGSEILFDSFADLASMSTTERQFLQLAPDDSAPVPEPSSLLLLASCMIVGIGWSQRASPHGFR